MKKFLLLCMVLAVLSFNACQKKTAETGPAAPKAPLRVGMMFESEQTLPFLVARDRGYFEQEGVNLELVTFSNPQDRDAAMQSGQLDGETNNILTTAHLIAAGFDYKITGMTYGRFVILGSPKTGITTLSDLRGGRIGIHPNSIPQYIVDTELEGAGVSSDEYEIVTVSNMPMRIEMLLEGVIDATCLGEPLSTMTVAQGAVVLATTNVAEMDVQFILFPKKVIDARLDEIKAFYRAYSRAMRDINADQDSFRGVMSEQFKIPAEAMDVYQFIEFPELSMPNPAVLHNFLGWMKAKGLLEVDLSPADMVDSRALSEWL